METQTVVLIAAIVGGLVVLALFALAAARRQRTQKLREQFGPEYDYTLNKLGDRQRAEQELAERQKRVASLEVHTLTSDDEKRFLQGWQSIQTEFVDEPVEAVKEASQLIKEVMIARGFPITKFEQRAADISVMYPDVAMEYRAAHEVALEGERGEASTEDLRKALIQHRALFEELLKANKTVEAEKAA